MNSLVSIISPESINVGHEDDDSLLACDAVQVLNFQGICCCHLGGVGGRCLRNVGVNPNTWRLVSEDCSICDHDHENFKSLRYKPPVLSSIPLQPTTWWSITILNHCLSRFFSNQTWNMKLRHWRCRQFYPQVASQWQLCLSVWQKELIWISSSARTDRCTSFWQVDRLFKSS